jgi:hypothetical protein
MKKKQLKIWVYVALSLITACNCLAAEKQLTKENLISQRHLQIEYSFMNKILNVRVRAAAQVRLLEVAEAYMSEPNWYDTNEYVNFIEKVLQINGCESEPYSLFRTDSLFKTEAETPAESLAVALSRIAKRKSDILSRSELEALNLEYQKKLALAYESKQLEKTIMANAEIKKSESIKGLITSIVYSPDKPSAVIDNKIVHNGDIIHGASVIKIDKDKVVFEKNRDRWQQAVRQTPSAHWE